MLHRRLSIAILVVLLAVLAPVPLAAHAAGAVTCTNSTSHDTAALQSALNAGGTVNVAAGTCALSAKLAVKQDGTVLDGAGQTATVLQQHSPTGVIIVGTHNNVTVENLTMDSRTFNVNEAMPQSGTLFSAGSHNSVINVIAIAGAGFDIRLTGSNPCSAYPTTGTIVSNVDVRNVGLGGYTPLDIDCTHGASLSNITVHGQYIALFQDTNVTLNGESYTRNVQRGCSTPIFITGPSSNIAISNVTGGGPIVERGGGPITNVTQTNVVRSPGC